MKQSPTFSSTVKLGRYDVINTPSGAMHTADVKLEPVITNVSGTGQSRIVTTQVINIGNFDTHNALVKVEVFSHGSRVKLEGQDYLRIDIGTVKIRQHITENYESANLSLNMLKTLLLTWPIVSIMQHSRQTGSG